MSTPRRTRAPSFEDDRRKDIRVLTLRTAKLSWPGQDDPVDCAVLDISAGGARVLVGQGIKLPEIFQISIDQWPGPPHTCKVAWRAGPQLGLEFETAAPDDAPLGG